MADREITLPEEIIYGDLPMTRKDANMSKKLPPKETMTMADVAEDFIPAEYRYIRDLPPEKQALEIAKLQEQWLQQTQKIPVKKKDDYGGARDVIATDAYGKSIVMPTEDYPEFQAEVKRQEADKELQRQQLPWELLMGLGGLYSGVSAGRNFGRNPAMEGRPTTTMSIPSVSPRAAAALTALASVAKPEEAEAARLPVSDIRYVGPTKTEPSKFVGEKNIRTWRFVGPREQVALTTGAGEGSAFDLVETFLENMPRDTLDPKEYVRSRLVEAGYNPKPETMNKAMKELEPLIETAVAKLPKYETRREANRGIGATERFTMVDKTERLATKKDGTVSRVRLPVTNVPRTERGYGAIKNRILEVAKEHGVELDASNTGIQMFRQLQNALQTRLEAAQKALQDLEQQGKEREATRKQQRRR